MKTKIKPYRSNLKTYLTLTLGAGAAASSASGAVIFYGKNSANDTHADPDGINFGIPYSKNYYAINSTDSDSALFALDDASIAFTDGSDLDTSLYFNLRRGPYTETEGGTTSFDNGARFGDQNYASITFDGYSYTTTDDYEAVAQFSFDGEGNGFLVALAFSDSIRTASGDLLTQENVPQNLGTLTGQSYLSISAGKMAIDAAAAPEPSSLVLLALGSTGLLARRRRDTA